MSVARHLYEYLMDQTSTIAGDMGDPFAMVQHVGRHEIRNRVEAREQLRAIIGQSVYENRHPREMMQSLFKALKPGGRIISRGWENSW